MSAPASYYLGFGGPPKEPEEQKTYVLDRAADLVYGARQAAYDHPLPNHERIARLYTARLHEKLVPGEQITPFDVMSLMRLTKEARLISSPGHEDSLVDLAGYAEAEARMHWDDDERQGELREFGAVDADRRRCSNSGPHRSRHYTVQAGDDFSNYRCGGVPPVETSDRSPREGVARVVFTGSRTWSDVEKVRAALETLPRDAVVVHGDARRGADAIVDRIAHEMGFVVVRFPARWRVGGVYNPLAGFERNGRMLDAGADLVIAFWDGRSRGTLDTIMGARRRGIEVVVIEP